MSWRCEGIIYKFTNVDDDNDCCVRVMTPWHTPLYAYYCFFLFVVVVKVVGCLFLKNGICVQW